MIIMTAHQTLRRRKYRPLCAGLEITLRCNMACLHCGSSATGRERPDHLSHGEWLKVIDDLKRIGTRYVTLSGGEPFLYPRWRELVLHIRKRGMEANFITNGSRITEDDVLFMKKSGVQHVGVSLDGDEATHDRIRRHPGSFRRIMELFALGRKHGFKVHVVTSINKINFPIRERILRVMLEQGVKLWQVQVVNSFGRAGVLRDTMLLDPRQYVRLCEDIRRWQKANGRRIRIAAADSIGYCHPLTDAILGDFEWRGCNAGMYVVGIQADGSVLGCLSLQAPDFIAGNVRRRRLAAIWNDDSRFAATRGYDVSRMEGACAACDAAKQCKAGCLGMAYSVDGSIYRNSTCYRAITAKKPARA